MSYIDGIDEYGAGRRRVEVTEEGAHVKLTIEGSGCGRGEVLLTTLQATALAGALEAAAIRIAEATVMTEVQR